MPYNSQIHHRRSIRLKGFDYSQVGLYFINISVQNKECLFGQIKNDAMVLNDAGKMVQTEWEKLPERFGNIKLDEFAVMPNHFHGILEIVEENDSRANAGAAVVAAPDAVGNPTDAVANDLSGQNEDQHPLLKTSGATTRVAPTDSDEFYKTPNVKTVGEMIGAFKSITTVEYINGVKNLGWEAFNCKLWQRDFYEHIIRDEQSYLRITAYIADNPRDWNNDELFM